MTVTKSDYLLDFIKVSSIKKKESIISRGLKLKNFTKRNLDAQHINKSVFHLLLEPFTLNNAYNNISKNKGSGTAGVDYQTIQGYKRKTTLKIIQTLKHGSYKQLPVKRVIIRKPRKFA